MEVIVDQSFWIWLAYLGFQMETMTLCARSINPSYKHAKWGMQFEVNDNVYTWYYFLANDIYPSWSYIVQTIHEPQDEKRFEKMQKNAKNDVEKCFGVL